MKRIYGMAVLAALFALAAPAQEAKEVLQKKMQEELSTAITRMKVIGVEGGVMSNVKNAPYHADQITENTQTLGDGTRIHNERKVTVYRDSLGRVRRESPDEISIWDPNSGVGYTLNPKSKTAGKIQVSVSVGSGGSGTVGYAFRTQTGTAGTGAVAGGGEFPVRVITNTSTNSVTASAGDVARVEFKSASAGALNKQTLGTQIMEGIGAQGERETNTIEAGALGNDRPIHVVSEHWYSADLQLDVKTLHSDPRTGEDVTRLINISRAEPDASLFQVPAGYEIVEGKSMPALMRLHQ